MNSRSYSSEKIEFPESHPEPLRSCEMSHDPFEWYNRKRATSPVHYDSDREVYDVFSYNHVKTALQDNERFVRKQLSQPQMTVPNPFSYIDNAMVWSDGSNHNQMKHQLFEYFRPDMLHDLRHTIKDITRSQLDTALKDGPEFDFITDFAVPVPLRIVMQLVGVPQQDHQQLLSWLETFREVMNTEYSAVESKNPAAMEATVDYFEQLVDARKTNPQDDLVSRLVVESDLSDAEIGANCFDFIMAGQGTMSEFLSNALYLFDCHGLFERSTQYEMEVVLEEVLRYRSPLQSRVRKTTEPVTLHETEIPGGESVVLWIGAANRDPRKYDEPDAFLPDRDPDHLAFGSGPHVCIGAPLARLEGPMIMRTIVDRIDDIKIHHSRMKPKLKASKLGFEQLPISVTPA